MPGNKKLFLSAVSSEFVSYRTLLAGDLMRPDLDVAVQEDFIVTGGSTLEKLDTYIRQCDGIIHLIGKATGAAPEERAVAALLAKYPDFGTRLPPLAEQLRKPQPGFSYTQWEAYLAIYHERPLFVYRPADFDLDTLHVPRDARFVFNADEEKSQRDHYRRICDLGHDRGQFLNEERLSSAVLRDLVEILPRLESRVQVSPTKLPQNAERLIGRDADLTRLDAAWNDPRKNVVIVRAFGGMGKTSLVATWMAELALKGWRGAARVFDWSFYSQGTRDQSAASADTFIADALRAFGDPDPTLGSPWDRGARLAHLVGETRCLLVLDGLEPLQHPTGPMQGRLKDAGIAALLKGLVARNAGLCVVTTREKVDDIKQHYGRSADDIDLIALTDLAGAALLHHAGATRAGARDIAADDRELQAASREVRGHGLTLQLLGQYLRLVEDGDILKRDTVRLADADREYQNDATRPYGHAFKAMEAYERWFDGEGEKGRRQLAVLRLLGLFDRPASKSCLNALRAAPAIDGLTGPLVGLDPREWRLALSRLKEINLLFVAEDGCVDCHALLREYFAMRLRMQQSEAWRAAHRRLYEHLCATTTDKKPNPTLEDLQPLYQAVAHGCQAGLQEEACANVYRDRIKRGEEHYTANKLGAWGFELGAITCFFETPWSRVSPSLIKSAQAWLLNEAAHTLHALGRLTEAIEPLRAGLENLVMQENWKTAAASASNLSELELTLGKVAAAVGNAELSVTYADRSGDWEVMMPTRTTHADALHQAGRRAEAEARIREAEALQGEHQPPFPLLYSLRGFRYCDLLLTEAELGAWQVLLRSSRRKEAHSEDRSATGERATEGQSLLTSAATIESCHAVSERAAQTIKIAERNNWLLDIALDHLTLGRAGLYEAVLSSGSPSSFTLPPSAVTHIESAVDGLRRAGTQDHLPRGLLTRAWQRFLTAHSTDSASLPQAGAGSAQSDLDEAWEIAERGPMPLFLADIHLHRARLFFREAHYPWDKNPDGSARGPADDLAAARAIITKETVFERNGVTVKHSYLRRLGELEDAEAALLPPA